jgi:hypothetical protein
LPDSKSTQPPLSGTTGQESQAAFSKMKATCTASYGNSTPSSVLSSTPAATRTPTSPCTDFTSRRTNRDTSRMVSGPLPRHVRADGGETTLLLETERERAPAQAKKLNLYKLRSKVTVEDRVALSVGRTVSTNAW